MYERFTDRARKVMQFANQEAQRLNHEFIAPEHILLGIVKEGTGVAANVLKNLDIDLGKIRMEVEKIVQAGPNILTMGKLPMTDRGKKVIECAIQEARTLENNYVGSEHVLLGLLRDAESVAGIVLTNLGVKIEAIREGIKSLRVAIDDTTESLDVLSALIAARTAIDKAIMLLTGKAIASWHVTVGASTKAKGEEK